MAKKAIDPRILESRRYWAEREEANRKATIRDEQEYAKGIREVLEKAAANIQKEIDAFYGRYAAREGITISDAKMRVSALDIKEYSQKAKQYVADKDFSKQANEEMRIYNLTMKINRLEMLKSNIGLELCASYSELENYFEDSLTKTARKEFRRQAGILGGTVANMEKHAGEIVNGSFRGAKFSERLWANQAYLKTQLDNLLRTGLIQGRNPRELAKSLRKEIETSVYVSERLMRTEMCRVQIGAQLASYQNMGYDKLVIIPEHDERSCDYCETQDGVIVEVAKAVPGVNVPPFHPNCRCSTAAWVDDMSTEKNIQKQEDAVEKSGKYATMNATEMFRKRNNLREGFHFISDQRFNELTIAARKQGALIYRGTEEVEEHLVKSEASSSCIGDVLLFRKQVAVSEVLEEVHHFIQNKKGMNDDKGEPLRTILNEIDAKKHLIENANNYQIPRNEVELLQHQLENYENQLDEIKRRG